MMGCGVGYPISFQAGLAGASAFWGHTRRRQRHSNGKSASAWTFTFRANLGRSLSAYCILLAPWSAVRIRTHSLNPDSAREMAIHAKREIAQGEFVYELAGQLAADAASKSKHTDLSTMRSCDRTKRILFGPIRWYSTGVKRPWKQTEH